jgi:hypothetical protein
MNILILIIFSILSINSIAWSIVLIQYCIMNETWTAILDKVICIVLNLIGIICLFNLF